jgi:branched-chain amino acid transport system ATP-binding protein
MDDMTPVSGRSSDNTGGGDRAQDNASEPVVVFTDVHLSFSGVQALEGVTFEVQPRELYAVIGPNGAGKTSIFNVLSGVYRPQRGAVRFLGTDILGRRPDAVAAMGIARTFQNIALFENLTVVDNLMLGRHLHASYGALSALFRTGRVRRDEARNRAAVEEIIDFLDIQEHRDIPVRLLPYGMQKRVELGRALAMRPRLLLLDEPTAGMNLEETQDMARFMFDIRDELHIAMILVEHDMGLVMDIADRVLVLDFGQPITVGAPSTVQRHTDVISAYLGQEHATRRPVPASDGTPPGGAP